MVNLILDSVSKQLGTTFGLDYHYYVEDVEQNLTKPCFTIDTLIPLQRSRNKILYDRTMPIVVHFFSDNTTNVKRDCYQKAEQIIECLEYLPVGDALLRGEDISWEIVEDVLQVFVTYKFMSKRVEDVEDAMNDVVETITRTQ